MPPSPDAGLVLALNGGSSSVKFALFAAPEGGSPPVRLLAGAAERVGTPDAVLKLARPGHPAESRPITSGNAAGAVFDAIDSAGELARVSAVGHRVVFGGPGHLAPELVTPGLLADLRALTPVDPAHLPGELALIDAATRRLPGAPQVACFDAAFHRTLPAVASRLPLPRRLADSGVRRYGFHGLSYEYLLGELARQAGPGAANGKVVLAHLGSGSSLAAVSGGECIDTTMGFTPTGGLVMGTRSGDLDPGVLVYLLRREKLSADDLDRLVNRESGLLGLSGSSGDVRDLLARRDSDARAAEALESYCYSARKHLGALAAALGGVETLVFSGGIGEHSPEIRAGICAGLDFLGIRLDESRNAASADVISPDGAACPVRVIATDEESAIAASVRRVLAP